MAPKPGSKAKLGPALSRKFSSSNLSPEESSSSRKSMAKPDGGSKAKLGPAFSRSFAPQISSPEESSASSQTHLFDLGRLKARFPLDQASKWSLVY